MKQFLMILIIGLILVSCKKDEYTPYKPDPNATPPPPNNTNTYVDGGTLPTGTGTNNVLFGTTWVLTKMVTSFSTDHPNDTIKFVSNTNYTINNSAVRPYQLSSIVGSSNKSLTLNFFYPFGGSSYSANVGMYFVDDGQMNNIEFRDIQNSAKIIKAWFIKI